MDKLQDTFNSFAGGNEHSQGSGKDNQQQKEGGGNFLSGLGDKINSAAGGGRESEKNEDMLDKGALNGSATPLFMARPGSSGSECGSGHWDETASWGSSSTLVDEQRDRDGSPKQQDASHFDYRNCPLAALIRRLRR
jgi:hypothetical protein